MRSRRLRSGATPTSQLGGRIQRNSIRARDVFDANAQGLPLDTSETQRATHLGIEHRFTPAFTVFGRMAQSFRLPNVDERVGEAPLGGVTDFNLRTQRSHDYEAASASARGRSICNPALTGCTWSTNCEP